MSHTRSGSSLLAQILSSNNSISGYGELFVKYEEKRESDLVNIPLTLFKKGKLKFLSKYYLDKILFEGLVVNEKIYDSEYLKIIFLYRSPEKALPSILKKEWDNNIHFSQKEAFEYYIKRIDDLRRIQSLIPPENRIIVHYETLVSDTQEELKRISSFLKLSSSLSDDYRPAKQNQAYLGDTSEYLSKGRVLKDVVSTARDVSFDTNLIEMAKTKYKNICF